MSKQTRARPSKLFKPETKLLFEQISFANLILVSKCDLIETAVEAELWDVLQCLGPQAHIVKCVDGAVPISAVLDNGKFSMQAAETDERWFAEAHADAAETQRLLPLRKELTEIPVATAIQRVARRRPSAQPTSVHGRSFCIAFGRERCDCSEC